MDAVILSRLQFAFTIGFHILWPAYTIGIAGFLAVLNGLWVTTGREIYRDLMRFWIHVFAIGFGMGVVTGLVLSYQIGTNWSGFAAASAHVLGPLFMYEVMTAFFLEAGFIGIMLFGERRVGKQIHLLACCMVAFGTVFSAFWIIAANSWMQTPAGFEMRDGVAHVTDWWKVVFNPSMPYRLLHMVTASYVTGAFIVAGVSAYYLFRNQHIAFAQKGFSMAMWAALILVPLQIFFGDMHGLNTRQMQPMKLAAMEGRWETARGVAATLFAWPNMAEERNDFEIAVPSIGSLILTHEWNGEVKGLKEVPPADRPYVPIVFFAFRIMVGIGFSMLGIAVLGGWLRWRGRLYEARWFHAIAMAATPLGFLAILAGWVVTESGRQPYVIYGVLRTANAASPVAAGAISASLVLFVVVYDLLLLAFFWYGARLVVRGPRERNGGARVRAGLELVPGGVRPDPAAAE